MRARVECPACGYTWTTSALDQRDEGRRHTHKRRGCHHCGAWRSLRILEVLPAPPPPPRPAICGHAGCATRLHSRAAAEGRTLCYVHERQAADAEVAAGVAEWEEREARRVERATGERREAA